MVVGSWKRCGAWLAALAIASLGAEDARADADRALAKTSQNPIGKLIALPFENNFDFDNGPEEVYVNVLNVKPVYPMELTDDLSILHRGIFPITYQEGLRPGQGSKFGLGDVTYQAFFSPKSDGALIWGAGPAFILDTATDDRLGSDQWSAGLSAVVLAMPGNWVVGGLAQQVWSVAGDKSADEVSSFLFQYFVNYNLPKSFLGGGWYLTSTPTYTANWKAKGGDVWTAPVGGGVGRLVRFGKLPVDFKLQAFWNAARPAFGADWSAQLQVKFLFPK